MDLLRLVEAHMGKVHTKDHIPLGGALIQRELMLGTVPQMTRRVGPFLRKTSTSHVEKRLQRTGVPQRPAVLIFPKTCPRRLVARFP